MKPLDEFNNNMALARDSLRRTERQIDRALDTLLLDATADGRLRLRREQVRILLSDLTLYDWTNRDRDVTE